MSENTLIAKLVIAHQIINCLTCPKLGSCQLTKELTSMSIRNRIDTYSLELIRECGDLKELSRALNSNDGQFINNLLRLKKRLSKKLGLKINTFNEGFMMDLGNYSLAVPNNDKAGNSRIFIMKYGNHGNCTLRIMGIDNKYLDYLIRLAAYVVPKGEYSLDELIRVREEFLTNFINDENLVRNLVLATLNLGELLPLINDDIEDIYITSDSMYVNHAEHGLCRVDNVDARRLANQLLKLANLSGIRVSVDNPSGKFSLDLGGKRLRITVDRWPLTEGVAVHIRLHKRPFSIIDLISLGTIDAINAAKLIVSLYRGSHLIIAGPPGSGKTTLLNALDATLPMNLRRIYIDETDESLDLPVPSAKVRALTSKVDEVLKSLHRGYGILIIGELREREHFEALIHGISSGLQVMGTTHAVNRESLMGRLKAFNVDDLIDLNSFILVFMNKEGRVRRVTEVLYPSPIDDDHIINKLALFLRSLRCDNACNCMIMINEFMRNNGFEV